MGKRNKGEQKDNCVKTKEKRSKSNAVVNDDITEDISIMESTGNGKNKKIVFDNDGSPKIVPVKKIVKEPDATTAGKRGQNKINGNRAKNMESNKTKQNKKIIFTDDNDEGTEVTVNKARKMENGSDEEPGEEEIDKFCEELDEEDNKQYENWVKLIEAKLGPNKKK